MYPTKIFSQEMNRKMEKERAPSNGSGAAAPEALKSCQAPNVFQVVVNDKGPIWCYCVQTNGNHCQKGMAGKLNQNFDSPNTLAACKALAAGTGISVIPPVVQGGSVIPNPNPKTLVSN
ncbi:hypothetical protein diail_5670 [Diaporthe ilicicola]|nr:hypothetical protein diail_5670 [Diaporthe ilicicola]